MIITAQSVVGFAFIDSRVAHFERFVLFVATIRYAVTHFFPRHALAELATFTVAEWSWCWCCFKLFVYNMCKKWTRSCINDKFKNFYNLT